MAGQKRKARLRARRPGHPRLSCRHTVKTSMPGIADKFTQSAQNRLRWLAMTSSWRCGGAGGPRHATARGFGIPLDRQNSVFAGSAAGTVGPPHRRPIVFDKSGKRRANTPAAPEASRGVRPGLKPKTGPYKETRKQGSVLTFGVLSKISIAKRGCHFQVGNAGQS